MTPRNTTLVVHIDELIAHGIDRRTAAQLGAALETELAQLIAGRGIPTRLRTSADITALTLPDMRHRPGTNAAGSCHPGHGLAAALYQELDRTDSSGGQHP